MYSPQFGVEIVLEHELTTSDAIERTDGLIDFGKRVLEAKTEPRSEPMAFTRSRECEYQFPSHPGEWLDPEPMTASVPMNDVSDLIGREAESELLDGLIDGLRTRTREYLVNAATRMGIPEDVMGVPAWKSHPSWYLVATNDAAIPPDAERMFAQRMRAHTVEVPSGHLAMVSHSAEVVELIEAAAETVAATPSGRQVRVYRIGPRSVHDMYQDRRALHVAQESMSEPGTGMRAGDQSRQLGVVKELTEIIATAAGDPTLSDRTWVLITESPGGGWAIQGHANTNADIADLARTALATKGS